MEVADEILEMMSLQRPRMRVYNVKIIVFSEHARYDGRGIEARRVQLHVVTGAEPRGEGDTVEIVEPLAIMTGFDIDDPGAV